MSRLMALLIVATLACSPSPSPARSTSTDPIDSLSELIDSLAQVGQCPRSDHPPIERPADEPAPFDSVQTCALVAGALRRLAVAPTNEPYFVPGDRGRVVAARVYWQVTQRVAAAASRPPDSAAVVEIDIQGRSHLFWVRYRLLPERELIGMVGR
jgi:hypothetical protein